MVILNDQQKRGKIRTFHDFCSTELKTYEVFNGVVIGFGLGRSLWYCRPVSMPKGQKYQMVKKTEPPLD